MTQLLISVKNADEARLAMASGADIIDLKDPNVGALGALDLQDTQAVLQVVGGELPVSATVGEGHVSLDALLDAVCGRFEVGVDIVKIAVSELFYLPDFVDKIFTIAQTRNKFIAVFFADMQIDFALFPTLKKAGFYGAMLDTQHKANSLRQVCSEEKLQSFAEQCAAHRLVCGLAGSLKPQDIENLTKFNPTYLGFRGGVCENSLRNNSLSAVQVKLAENLLHKHNKLSRQPLISDTLGLHGR